MIFLCVVTRNSKIILKRLQLHKNPILKKSTQNMFNSYNICHTYCNNKVFLKKFITYFIEYIFVTCEYKCAPQLCHLLQQFAGNMDILAFALEVQSLLMKRYSCDQLTLPGC